MERQQGFRVPPYQPRQDRDCREDAAASDEREPGAPPEVDVVRRRAVAGMLELGRGPNQTPLQREVHPRLQVREVGHRYQQLAVRPKYTIELREGLRLLLEGEMFEDIEAQCAIEGRRRVRQGRH